MIQVFETLSCLSKQGCNMIQIFESLDIVLSDMHVSCFKHVISVLGIMAHTSHLCTNINNHTSLHLYNPNLWQECKETDS
jgi:hypothetical protein